MYPCASFPMQLISVWDFDIKGVAMRIVMLKVDQWLHGFSDCRSEMDLTLHETLGAAKMPRIAEHADEYSISWVPLSFLSPTRSSQSVHLPLVSLVSCVFLC